MDVDLGYPAYPSLPSVLYEFNGAFSSSEGSTPADRPTFYKCGESSRLAEMKPVFHSSANDTYKVWWNNNNLRGEESDLSHSFCQDSNQETGLWEDVEMGFDPMRCGSPCNHRSHHDTATQWPTRDNTVSCSIPVSVARSSLYCLETSQTSFGADWRGSPLEDDLFGPASPLSSTSFEQDASHPFLVGTRPHNYPHDSTGSPYFYRPSASSQPLNMSPIAITSPNSPPSSPSLASSYSSSASSSSCPPTPPTTVLLPELHQPRPARPIPIIPLSKLATTCEEFYMPSRKSSSVFPKLRHSFGEPQSFDLLSHKFTKSDNHDSWFPLERKSHDTLPLQYFGDGKPDGTYPYFNSWSGHSR